MNIGGKPCLLISAENTFNSQELSIVAFCDKSVAARLPAIDTFKSCQTGQPVRQGQPVSQGDISDRGNLSHRGHCRQGNISNRDNLSDRGNLYHRVTF